MLPVGTRVRSTDDLFTPKAWGLQGHLVGAVIGHKYGYNKVQFPLGQRGYFPAGEHSHWLATDAEVEVIA